MPIVKQILELYIRKRGTSDIDYNIHAALLLFFVSIAVTTIAISTQRLFQPPLATAIAAQLIEIGMVYAMLNFYKKTTRFIQTITAMMGVTLITHALIVIALNVNELAIFTLFINLWSLYLSITILKDVLECSFLKALAIVFALTFVSAVMLLGMFGDAEVIAQLQEQSQSRGNSSPDMLPSGQR